MGGSVLIQLLPTPNSSEQNRMHLLLTTSFYAEQLFGLFDRSLAGVNELINYWNYAFITTGGMQLEYPLLGSVYG